MATGVAIIQEAHDKEWCWLLTSYSFAEQHAWREHKMCSLVCYTHGDVGALLMLERATLLFRLSLVTSRRVLFVGDSSLPAAGLCLSFFVRDDR